MSREKAGRCFGKILSLRIDLLFRNRMFCPRNRASGLVVRPQKPKFHPTMTITSSDEEVISKEESLDSGTGTDCCVEAGIADSDREPTSDEVETTETRVVVGRTETKFDPDGATIGSDAELVRTDRMKLDLDAKSGDSDAETVDYSMIASASDVKTLNGEIGANLPSSDLKPPIDEYSHLSNYRLPLADKGRVGRVGPDNTRHHNYMTWTDMESTFPAIAPRHALVGKASPGKAASDAKCDSRHPGKVPPG